MAVEILQLQAILTGNPIEHEPQHDIELFIYVLAYSVTRRAVLKSQPLDDSLSEDTTVHLPLLPPPPTVPDTSLHTDDQTARP